MPQSLSINLVHIIFSTKNREPLLDPSIRKRLYPYTAQLIRDKNSECYRIGGVEDHVHLARLSPFDPKITFFWGKMGSQGA